MRPGGEPLQVGEAQAAGFSHLVGAVDELLICDRPLSAEEVLQAANQGRMIFEKPARGEDGTLDLRLHVPVGKTYVVEASSYFAIWTKVAGGLSDGSVIVVHEPTTSRTVRFYRARVAD